MTTRMQVTFEPEEHRRAKRRASELGISLAEFVRRAVDDALGEPSRAKVDISDLFGIANSGGSDVANHKDEHVAEAIGAHLEQRRR